MIKEEMKNWGYWKMGIVNHLYIGQRQHHSSGSIMHWKEVN